MTTGPVMPTTRRSRAITCVWLALIGLTALGWWLAPGHTAAHPSASVPITVVVLMVGLIKSRLIIRYFMEVRTAPMWLRRSTDAWLVVLFGSILVIYLL